MLLLGATHSSVVWKLGGCNKVTGKGEGNNPRQTYRLTNRAIKEERIIYALCKRVSEKDPLSIVYPHMDIQIYILKIDACTKSSIPFDGSLTQL